MMPKRGAVAAGLTQAPLAGRRLFHFGTHSVQVVSGGNHREKDHKNTGQRQ